MFYNESVVDIIPVPWESLVSILTFGTAMTVIAAIGIIGNVSTIWTLIRHATFKSPFNTYMINIAAADVCTCAISFPLTIISCWFGKWMFHDIGCSIYAFINSIVGLYSIHVMAAMSLERYIVIANPLSVYKTSTQERSRFYIIVCWILSVLWSLPPLIGWNSYVKEGIGMSCSIDSSSENWADRSYVLVLFFCAFCLPLSIIVTAYAGILRTIRTAKLNTRALQQTTNPLNVNHKLILAERRVIRVGFIMSVVFVLAWGPYASIVLCGIFGLRDLHPLIVSLPALFAKSNTMYNPLIYFLMYPKFRRRFILCRPVRCSYASEERVRCYHPRQESSLGSSEPAEVAANTLRPTAVPKAAPLALPESGGSIGQTNVKSSTRRPIIHSFEDTLGHRKRRRHVRFHKSAYSCPTRYRSTSLEKDVCIPRISLNDEKLGTETNCDEIVTGF